MAHRKDESGEAPSAPAAAPAANPWAGRFGEAPHPLVQRYTVSLPVDRRLALHDLRGSEAHVKMLAQAGLLQGDEACRLLEGLDAVRREIESGAFPFRPELEDIHMNVEVRLRELVGPVAEKLHTGRSRNDQVVLDVALYCRETARAWRTLIRKVCAVLVRRAEDYAELLYPAWTHLQAAQPMSFGHYLLGLGAMLRRVYARLEDFERRNDVSPLGAGALSGSSLPLDPAAVARELGFARSFANSYETVGSRDTILELLQIATQLMLHLSRIAEDFIYMASTPVGWIDLPDALCTGSSMMPQKKNPDLLELMRGKAAGVIGHEQAVTVLLKGLPTSYHRDLQQDKEHLFAAADVVEDSLQVLELLLAGFQVRRDRVERALGEGFLMATELAEYLVNRGVPFRRAHHLVGRLVRWCEEQGKRLEDLQDAEIRELIPEAGADVTEVLRPEHVLERRVPGSTGRESVRQQLAEWRRWLEGSA
ncbi:MAG: argininosuccinate lyase [Acidobacteriota bacterium]